MPHKALIWKLARIDANWWGAPHRSQAAGVPLGLAPPFAAKSVIESKWPNRSRADSLGRLRLTVRIVQQAMKGVTNGLFEIVISHGRLGVLRMGTVALDGTKIHANASRHSALSYEHAGKIEAQLKAEVAELLAKAEAADQANIPDGVSIPEELARREDRLDKLAAAREKIEARARERFARMSFRPPTTSSRSNRC